jgi:phosphoribosyl-AMP cyclohydrolase
MSDLELEEGVALQLDFSKLGKVAACGEDVIPAVVQDANDGEVLLIGYVNRKALETTLATGQATFWSTSRNELWIKGATSGDVLEIVDVRVNCEQNSLLYRVIKKGAGSCHTKDSSGRARSGCFYRKLAEDDSLEYL